MHRGILPRPSGAETPDQGRELVGRGRPANPSRLGQEGFAGNRLLFPVISRDMANKEQHKEKKNKKQALKTKAEKRAARIAKRNAGK
jgi:hypothetical protein